MSTKRTSPTDNLEAFLADPRNVIVANIRKNGLPVDKIIARRTRPVWRWW
jgi:hypothetical protein